MGELAKVLAEAQNLGIVAWMGLFTVLVLVNTIFIVRWAIQQSRARKLYHGNGMRRASDGNPANPHVDLSFITSRCSDHATQLSDLREAVEIGFREVRESQSAAMVPINARLNAMNDKLVVLWAEHQSKKGR